MTALCAPSVAAQAAASQPAPATASPAIVTEPQLRSFARAMIELSQIQQEMAPQIAAAPADAQPQLQQQAQQRMLSAVERHDLNREAFNEISAAVQQDPQLEAQVRTYVQEELAGR